MRSQLTSPVLSWCPFPSLMGVRPASCISCYLRVWACAVVPSPTHATRRGDGEAAPTSGAMFSNVVRSSGSVLCVPLSPCPPSLLHLPSIHYVVPHWAVLQGYGSGSGEVPALEGFVHTGLFQPPRWGLLGVSFLYGLGVIHC